METTSLQCIHMHSIHPLRDILVYRKCPTKRNLNHTPVKSNTIKILIKINFAWRDLNQVRLRLFHWITFFFG